MNLDHALIRFSSTENRFWLSCDIIEKAYDEVFSILCKEIEVISILNNCITEDQCDVIKNIIEEKKCSFFFNSHVCDINSVLLKLRSKINLSLVHIIIPVFGDMTVEVDRWMRLSHNLRDLNVTLLCSSIALAEQTSRLVINPDNIKVIPYPLESSFFTPLEIFHPVSKIELVYAGRISLGKNILDLMQTFIRASFINEKINLTICGAPSAEGHHLFGLGISQDLFNKKFQDLINASNGRIHYLGMLEQKDLKDVFDRSDYVISMSTYHDEDFGVAIAQAQARGCEPILTDWGGYQAYESCILKVSIKYDSYHIPVPNLTELTQILAHLEKPLMPRSHAHQESIEKFSSIRIAQSLLNVFYHGGTQYLGQTDLFKQYAQLFQQQSGSPFKDIINRFEVQQLYKTIYHSFGAPNN